MISGIKLPTSEDQHSVTVMLILLLSVSYYDVGTNIIYITQTNGTDYTKEMINYLLDHRKFVIGVR